MLDFSIDRPNNGLKPLQMNIMISTTGLNTKKCDKSAITGGGAILGKSKKLVCADPPKKKKKQARGGVKFVKTNLMVTCSVE